MSRRGAVVTGAVVVAAGGFGGWRWWAGSGRTTAPSGAPAMRRATVTRTDLAAREQLGGSLGFAGRWDVVHAGQPGIVTAVPPLGQIVQRGQILYEVDGRPEPMRVAAVTTPVGGHVGPGPLLHTTSGRRVVTVDVPTSRQGNVSPGGEVLVTLPGGVRLTARVAEVGRVAVSAQDNGTPPTVTVTATLDQPDAAGTLDQVPVQVSVTTAQRKGVLAVPVTALIASGSGGYQIRTTRLITVKPGLFDEVSGLIEISGDGLVEGMSVEVPAG